MRQAALFFIGCVAILLVAGVCWYLAGLIIEAFGFPPVVRVIVIVVFALAALYFLVLKLGLAKWDGPPL